MLEFASPLWVIVALGAIPFVWWIHRFYRPHTYLAVSALFLWKSGAQDEKPGLLATRTDPWWIIRAFTVVCLALAAAQPGWRGSAAGIVEVWFDDSPSMRVHEADGQRSQIASQSLLSDLKPLKPSRVIIHSLANPGRILELEPASSDLWAQRLTEWLRFDSLESVLPIPAQI